MIIDAKDMVLGRIATVAAKKSLLGEKVDIVNCSKAIITGKKEHLIEETKRRKDQGTFKGPFIPKSPDRFVRRVIRGMLPYKQDKGKLAFKRVMCYNGMPKELEGKETEKIKGAHISKMKNQYYLSIEEICKKI